MMNSSPKNHKESSGFFLEGYGCPGSDLESGTLFASRHCESRQKREKARGNLIEKGEIASVPSQ
jgi:hypothetical protein